MTYPDDCCDLCGATEGPWRIVMGPWSCERRCGACADKPITAETQFALCGRMTDAGAWGGG